MEGRHGRRSLAAASTRRALAGMAAAVVALGGVAASGSAAGLVAGTPATAGDVVLPTWQSTLVG